MSNIEEIAKVAREFQHAFELTDLADAPGFLPHFPEGCCTWATWMLGHYFASELGFHAVSVQGTRPGEETTEHHEWLLVDGTTVDITGDQFPDNEHKVVVERQSPWHSTWETERPSALPPPERWDAGQPSPSPSEIYERIVRKLRAAA